MSTVLESLPVESLDFDPELLCDMPDGCIYDPPNRAEWRCIAVPCRCVRLLCSDCVAPLADFISSSAMSSGDCELCGSSSKPMPLREFFRVEPIR